MIQQILELLAASEHYGKSELIEIAKGKNQLHSTLKGKREQLKRERQWRLKKQ